MPRNPVASTPTMAFDRSMHIGGSDIGAIIGVSKWKTALALYMEKTGQAPPEAPDEKREKIFRRGKRFEPIIIEMLAEERGLNIVARNQRYADPDFEFMACEIDAECEIDGERVNIEIKTSHPFAAGQWGEEGTDEIDVSYAAQAMYGMGITGRKRCIFGVLIGSDNLVTYEVIFNEDTFAAMRNAAVAFWFMNVQVGVPPDPVNLPDLNYLFNRKDKTLIAGSEEAAVMVRTLLELSDEISVCEGQINETKFQLGKFMLGAEAVALDEKGRMKPLKSGKPSTAKVKEHGPGYHVLTWQGKDILTLTFQETTRLDGDRIKKEHPEIAAECVTKTESFVFRPKRNKA